MSLRNLVPSHRACTDINGSGTVKSSHSKPLTTPINPGWPNPSCTPGKQLCCVKVLRSPCPRPVRQNHWTGRQELATIVFKSCSQCSKSQQISQREDWSFLLSSFSTSTQQINFHHAKRRQCPKAGLSTAPRADHWRTRDLSRHTEKSHLPPYHICFLNCGLQIHQWCVSHLTRSSYRLAYWRLPNMGQLIMLSLPGESVCPIRERAGLLRGTNFL